MHSSSSWTIAMQWPDLRYSHGLLSTNARQGASEQSQDPGAWLQQTIECCTFICNDGENNDPLNMNCSFWFPLQCLQPFQRHVLASGYCQFGFGVRFYGYIYNTMWLSSGRKNANSLKTRYSCQMCPSAVPLHTADTTHCQYTNESNSPVVAPGDNRIFCRLL